MYQLSHQFWSAIYNRLSGWDELHISHYGLRNERLMRWLWAVEKRMEGK